MLDVTTDSYNTEFIYERKDMNILNLLIFFQYILYMYIFFSFRQVQSRRGGTYPICSEETRG